MQVLYASPPRQASIATSFGDFRPAHARASLWLFSLFFFFYLFCFCFLVVFFVLFFLLLYICLLFPCSFWLIGWFFYNFADLLYICFAVLRPLLGLFSRPTTMSFQHPLHCTISAWTWSAFIFLYFCCLFACNKSFLGWPAFGCDAWSKPLGCGREFYHIFQVEKDKCWLGVLSPQCQ